MNAGASAMGRLLNLASYAIDAFAAFCSAIFALVGMLQMLGSLTGADWHGATRGAVVLLISGICLWSLAHSFIAPTLSSHLVRITICAAYFALFSWGVSALSSYAVSSGLGSSMKLTDLPPVAIETFLASDPHGGIDALIAFVACAAVLSIMSIYRLSAVWPRR